MSEKKYFIHIATTSLAHYFVRGCIIPTKYINNKAPDIQDLCEEGIIVSDKKWSNNTDCSIEIVLTKDEIANLYKINNNYSVYYSLLPISRILQIYFNSIEQSDTTVWNINKGAGFVPNRLIKIQEKKTEEISDDLEINNELNRTKKDLEKAIKAFDMLMGGFAFMKIGTDDPNDRMLNYSENYIPTLSYFNKSIAREYHNYKKTISSKFISLFSDEKSELFKYKQYLNSEINLQLLEEIAKDEDIKIEEKFGVIKTSNIPKTSLLYTLSILATYGVQKQKSINNLFSDILECKISNDKIEEVCLIYGLNIGYTALHNSYISNEQKKTIKFELNSKLDYYIIESLFLYSLNKEISSDFDYLLDIIPQERKQENSPFGYLSYRIFDTIVITKKKDYLEYFENFSKKLVSEISKWFPQKYFKIDSDALENHIQEELKPNISSLIRQLYSDIAEKIKNIEFENDKKIKNMELDFSKRIKNIEFENDKKIKNIELDFNERIKNIKIDNVEKTKDIVDKDEAISDNSSNFAIKNHSDDPPVIDTSHLTNNTNSGVENKEIIKYDKLKKKELQNILKENGISYKSKDTNETLREKCININSDSDLNPNLFEKQ